MRNLICIGVFCFGIMLIMLSCKSNNTKSKNTNQEFLFGVIADCQYWDEAGSGTRKYSQSSTKLKESVEHFNSQNLAFSIHLGDFIDRSWESFKIVTPIYNKLKAPYYHVLGNHDFSVLDDKKSEVRERLNMPSDYYDFKVEGWRFIVLNGNDISFHAYPKDSEMYKISSAYYERNEIESPKWNGAIGKIQMNWFKEVLNKASKRNEKVVVFCHFPVYPKNNHNLWNADEIIEIIENYSCVKAYMNGHNHVGNYGVKNGVHYLTLKAMVETEQNSYAIIKLNHNYIELKGYGREQDKIFKIME